MDIELFKSRAEQCEGFLLFLLREQLEAKGPFEIEARDDINHNNTLNGKGVYFIFWSEHGNYGDGNNQNGIYPLYVGITGNSFKVRLRQHQTDREAGVIYKVLNNIWPTEGLQIGINQSINLFLMHISNYINIFREKVI